MNRATRTNRRSEAHARRIPLSVKALQAGIDGLGRAVQLASDVWDLHSGLQHFPELALLRFCPASSGGSWSCHFAFSPNSTGCRSFLLAALLSVPACSFTELVSRLSEALMNVHDLPAAIKPKSRSFSSNVQRILGMTHSFSRAARSSWPNAVSRKSGIRLHV
jgi:hypothetical protein